MGEVLTQDEAGVRQMWLLNPILLFASSGLMPRATVCDCVGFVLYKFTQPRGQWKPAPTDDLLAKACVQPRYVVHQGSGVFS